MNFPVNPKFQKWMFYNFRPFQIPFRLEKDKEYLHVRICISHFSIKAFFKNNHIWRKKSQNIVSTLPSIEQINTFDCLVLYRNFCSEDVWWMDQFQPWKGITGRHFFIQTTSSSVWRADFASQFLLLILNLRELNHFRVFTSSIQKTPRQLGIF